MSTTGKMVAFWRASGSRVFVGKDIGPYEGTRPEINVRKLDVIHSFGYGVSHEAWVAATSGTAGYGCGWGDTGKLYPVTQDQIDAMVSANKAEEADLDEGVSSDPHLCPLCNSYCYGDCQAD